MLPLAEELGIPLQKALVGRLVGWPASARFPKPEICSYSHRVCYCTCLNFSVTSYLLLHFWLPPLCRARGEFITIQVEFWRFSHFTEFALAYGISSSPARERVCYKPPVLKWGKAEFMILGKKGISAGGHWGTLEAVLSICLISFNFNFYY